MKSYVCNRGWTWYSTEHILQNTYDSVDYDAEELGGEWSWEIIVHCSAKSAGFMYLVRSIQRYGWKSAVGWDNGMITEGHHRLSAGILLAEDYIPTTPHGTNWINKNGKRHMSAHMNRRPEGLYLFELEREDSKWK